MKRLPVENQANRSFIMSQIKKKDTAPELKVRRFLFSKGFRFRLHVKNLPGNPDIVLPKYRIVVTVNGCFWHMHEGCRLNKPPKSRLDYWLPKLNRNVERDVVNAKLLKKAGWKQITVWECQLSSTNEEKTLRKLYDKILKQMNICIRY
jgi:DNA mismatch endonuclease, patch repair protein